MDELIMFALNRSRRWVTTLAAALTVLGLGIAFTRPANATQVSAASAQMTLIGNVVAGRAYVVTAQGTADLYAGWNSGQGLTFTPDGKPTYSFPSPYSSFNPAGLDYDPSVGPSAHGVAGPQRLFGSLVGSFTANPQNPSDYFVIGSSCSFTATTSGPLYAMVNDTAYGDNGGSFNVTVSEVQNAVVPANSSNMTLIGNVLAGTTYTITARGTADLYAGWNGGQGLTFTPDGRPTYPFPSPYSPFYPSGLDYDPSAGTSVYGAAGPQKLLGSLVGSFTANPQGPGDYFELGSTYSFTASASGPLYAMVNDTGYADNAGSFNVTVSATQGAIVPASSSAMTFIGNAVAGTSYAIIASGTADLYAGWNGGQGLTFTPDGRPTYPFPSPYSPFYPSGLDHDPSAGSTTYGAGGPQRLFGSLLGAFTPNPQSASDYFVVGSSYGFTANVSGPVYAKVNDDGYNDNRGSYTAVLVPLTSSGNAPETTSYIYDALGRLVTVKHAGGPNDGVTSSYTLDAAGNRVQVQVTGAH